LSLQHDEEKTLPTYTQVYAFNVSRFGTCYLKSRQLAILASNYLPAVG